MAVRVAALRVLAGSFLSPQVRISRLSVTATAPATPRILLASLRVEAIPSPDVLSDWYTWSTAGNTWLPVSWHARVSGAWVAIGDSV